MRQRHNLESKALEHKQLSKDRLMEQMKNKWWWSYLMIF